MLALWYFDPWPAAIRTIAALSWTAAVGLSLLHFSLARTASTVVAAALLIALVWAFREPSNTRDWSPDQARLPQITFDGDLVHVRNLRNATYRTADDYDVNWYDRTFDLRRLARVDFMVETFQSWRGPAHTLVTFGFDDGEHVVVSVEIRKERGETFSPLAGLFRQYELMYAIGDERDFLGLRANVRHDPVFLYPIRARRDQVRAMFEAMLRRAQQLARQPEFYNTLTNTCTTNIVGHLDELAYQDIGIDARVLLPGYADRLAFQLDLIDFDGTLEEARARFHINSRSAWGPDAKQWSRQIRTQ
jgi:hypothetical protein